MNRLKTLLQLYWAFFKIGGLTFGGGLTMLPMLEHELVNNKKWITSDELLDCYAIGQSTPGIIAVNTATFVGYKKEKVAGGIFATLGMVTPSLVIITIAAMCLQFFMTNETFQHAMMGIRGVVCALMLNTVLNLAKKSLINITGLIIFAIILTAAFFFKVPAIILILITAATGILIELIKGSGKKTKEEKENV
mgnify:CR=1 FL=1